jgi:hypothetical protein
MYLQGIQRKIVGNLACMVSKYVIQANLEKIKAIRNMRAPKAKRDVVDGVFWYTKHVHYTLVWI